LITAGGTLNVIDLSGINLSGSSRFTINGNSNDVLVFNVSGNVSISGSAQLLLSGGLSAANVIFNVTSGTVSVAGAGVAAGTFLDVIGEIDLSGSAAVQGALISKNIKMKGSSAMSADPFSAQVVVAGAPELPTIAMAGLASLLVLGRAGISRLRRNRCTTTEVPPPP
jgi:choice-of-anchor A domain-containing protein